MGSYGAEAGDPLAPHRLPEAPILQLPKLTLAPRPEG